jgi:DNA-binding response OmpR family regulator
LRDQPEPTVLVLSCLANARSKVDYFELGARDYLTRPFSLEELLARETSGESDEFESPLPAAAASRAAF